MKGEEFPYREKVFSFLQGELNPGEEGELLEWLKADRGHRTLFLKEQEVLRKEIVQINGRRLDGQWANFISRLDQEQTHFSIPKKPFPYARILAIAAAFILGLLIPSIFYFVEKEDDFAPIRQVQEVSIPFGAKTSFQLPDGSMVWLNSGSKLSFPLQYSNDRTVTLDGEAYFDVIKSKKPFIVSTNYGRVNVMGTSFNLKAYKDGEFQATLVSGSVRVDGIDGKSVVLSPGEQSSLNQKAELSKRKVDPVLFTSWKDGKLIFYREPFEKMARRLERWYNVKIEINNQDMDDLRFTGTIEMETLSEVMDLINRTMPVQYSYERNTRILKIYKKGGTSDQQQSNEHK